jgi:hypothetical protein
MPFFINAYSKLLLLLFVYCMLHAPLAVFFEFKLPLHTLFVLVGPVVNAFALTTDEFD